MAKTIDSYDFLSKFPSKEDETCAIADCDKPIRSIGYCHSHYNKLVKCGDPLGKLRTIICASCGVKFTVRGRGRYSVCSDECKKAAVNRATSKWRGSNKEHQDRLTKQWRKNNPERHRNNLSRGAYNRRTRVKIARVDSFTDQQLQDRLSMWPGCWICNDPTTEVDHVKPISKGGLHILANMRPTCTSCNRKKYNKWPLTEQLISQIRMLSTEQRLFHEQISATE